MSLKVAIQMDPIEGINITTDTSFMMMMEVRRVVTAYGSINPSTCPSLASGSLPAGAVPSSRPCRAITARWDRWRPATCPRWMWS